MRLLTAPTPFQELSVFALSFVIAPSDPKAPPGDDWKFSVSLSIAKRVYTLCFWRYTK